MKKIIIIVVMLLISIGAYYYSKSGYVVTPAPFQYPTHIIPGLENRPQNPDSPAVSASVSVNIKNFSFSPSTLNIKTGTNVTWVNNDSVSHTVTSDSGSLLNSPTLSPGQSFSFTFTNTGSFSYHCAIHPMMKGSVVVQN